MRSGDFIGYGRSVRVCHQCGGVAKPDDRFCASCGAALSQDASSATADPLVGRTIRGAYILQEIVGVGGMGRVYRAEQTALGRTVAVKVIHPHLLNDEQTVARFYTEARASSRLNHPNSVSVIDFGRTDDGILFLAMEFLKGKDLATVMHEEGPLPFPRICDVLCGVLEALQEAHLLDIVHRDLKPENIILRKMHSGEELVKVVDFGLATIVGPEETSITRPGLVCGTPDYMPPEQGKGEPVDGRGDLYALGVVLFELLTDQLPYDDETPTKVVLRHINDPVPDPRVIAPHRNIPDALAEIALKALQKSAGDRYASATDMSNALKAAGRSLAKADAAVLCPACGAENPAQMRFCGSCGNRITGAVPVVPPTPSMAPAPKPSFYPPLGSKRPFVGRVAELKQLDGFRERATSGFVQVWVEGEPGVGKTRLLKEVAERFAERGDVVFGAAPHPTGAPVPFGPVRTLAATALELDEDALSKVADDGERFQEPLIRAGFSELAKPVGIVGFEGRSRAGAVAEAVAASLRVALGRSRARCAVVVVDDLARCDCLSKAVIAELPRILAKDPVLLLTADLPVRDFRGDAISLSGLNLEEAGRFLTGKGTDPEAGPRAAMPGRRMLPLYLEQILALGGGAGNDDTLPPRLADAIEQRIERLDVRARRLLQQIAVFGGRCELDELSAVAEAGDFDGLDELNRKSFVQVSRTVVEVAHPFIAELVEASIPAQARRQMHERVLEVISDRGAALEVRAEHAYRAGEGMTTFMTLERMGDIALARGDARAGVRAYLRALELARRAMLEGGDLVMDTAIVTFSRKLAWAMARSGELAGADGVVREVIDLTGPNDATRAELYVVLGKVAMLRDRRRDGMRHYGKALEIVAGVHPRVEAALQQALGRARRDDGELLGASNAFRRSLECHEQANSSDVPRAMVATELAEVLVASERPQEAVTRAEEAMGFAQNGGAPAVEARALGLLGRIQELSGGLGPAAEYYRRAGELAAAAGDAAGLRRWTDAARLLS